MYGPSMLKCTREGVFDTFLERIHSGGVGSVSWGVIGERLTKSLY